MKTQNKFPIFIYSILDVQNHKKYTYMCRLRQVNSSGLFYRTFHSYCSVSQITSLERLQSEQSSLVASSQYTLYLRHTGVILQKQLMSHECVKATVNVLESEKTFFFQDSSTHSHASKHQTWTTSSCSKPIKSKTYFSVSAKTFYIIYKTFIRIIAFAVPLLL